MTSLPVRFPNADGQILAGRLEMPAHGKPRAFAIHAHCFTCGKDVRAAVNICRALCLQGIAALRFDFAGLGESEGDFSETNFSSNIADIISAADFLAKEYQAPQILVGHSLGGAAVLQAASRLKSCEAVVTIGAPANPSHVARLLGEGREKVEREGVAEIVLSGRRFTFKKQFLDDLEKHGWHEHIHNLRKPLLIFHSPVDRIVPISNAAEIYATAVHPKSFIALNDADHLLTRSEDSEYVGGILAAWARKYLGELGIKRKQSPAAEGEVVAQLGETGLCTDIFAGDHALTADEPVSSGGMDTGPSPYGLLSAALGACTAMTVRMYANFKSIPLKGVNVRIKHAKIHADDCASCETTSGKLDNFEREIELEGVLSDDQKQRLLEIADKCPIHKTLHSEVVINTRLME